MSRLDWVNRRIGCGPALGLAAAAAAVVVVVVVVALVLAPGARRRSRPAPAPPAPARPAPSGTAFGASVNLLFDDRAFTPAQVRTRLAALRATGASFARSDALWEASEPQPPRDGVHHYDWLFDDIVAVELARAGLRWLPIIDYSAPWAQSVHGEDHSPPRRAADYAAYARAFAAQYGAGGRFWRAHPDVPDDPVTTFEVWNEPDNPAFWYPQPDPAAYARLYAQTRAAIDAVDPAARVIVGGLTHATTFLPALLHAMPSLRGHLDGVAIHPYGRPATVLRRVAAARRTLRDLGMGTVPLYVTEFGWTTGGTVDFAPARRRPAYLRATLSRLRAHAAACGLAAVSLYTWSGGGYGIDAPGAFDDAAVTAFAAGIGGRAPRASATC